MKVANIAKTRNQLSQLLRRVKRGETVIITDRDRPVARLTPIDMAAAPSASELDTLFASGALLPFVGSPLDVDAFLAAPRAVMRADASLTAAVLSERQEGR